MNFQPQLGLLCIFIYEIKSCIKAFSIPLPLFLEGHLLPRISEMIAFSLNEMCYIIHLEIAKNTQC